MTKTPEQEANELVEMFFDKIEDIEYGDWIDGRKKCAVECATLHVERLIEVLYKAYALWHIVPHYQQVLQILKDKK